MTTETNTLWATATVVERRPVDDDLVVERTTAGTFVLRRTGPTTLQLESFGEPLQRPQRQPSKRKATDALVSLLMSDDND